MTDMITIHWFRQDLRLSDNPALSKAAENDNVLPIYILDDKNSGDYFMGAASRWWLHYSLKYLQSSLDDKLSVYRGDPETILEEIMQRFKVKAICWNRCYEPWRINRDKRIKAKLQSKGIEVNTFNCSLLWEPWNIKKDDGTPYKVFTPFYRKGCLAATEPRRPLLSPQGISYVEDPVQDGIDSLNLLPKESWGKSLESHWDIGEEGAHKRFETFLDEGISSYKEGRNFPAKPFVSRLSPYLHFGQISPNHLWYKVRGFRDDKNIDNLCIEL